MKDILIRPLDQQSVSEIDLVATRMRDTLKEVLGQAEGEAMYSMDWLRERVRFHFDKDRSLVLLAEDMGAIMGHTILRIEEKSDSRYGLFSTIYIVPEHRRKGIAKRFIKEGESWIRAHGLSEAVTFTAEGNTKLIALFSLEGYAVVEKFPDEKMIKISKKFVGLNE